MRSADGRSGRACRGRLGGSNLGAQGRPMSRSCHRLSRNRRRQQGRLGIQLPLDLARLSHLRSVRAGPRPCRRFHRPYRTRQVLPEGHDGDYRRRPLARRRAGAARGLFRSRIRRVYAFDPSMVTGFYSVDPPNRDRNVRGLGIERVYEFGEVLAYPRLIMLHYHPFVPLQSACRQRPLPGLSRRSNRPPQPDRSGQRTAPGRQRLRTGEVADGARAVRRDPETAAGRIAMRRSMLCLI